MEKVYFDLGNETESLWAEALDGGAATFTIMNYPFYARNVSFLDVVHAVPRKEGNGYDFVSITIRGGHSTYRIFVKSNTQEFERRWLRLESLGCTYESATVRNGFLYAVDVPDTTDIYSVYHILNEGQERGVWGFEEAHVGHKLE